MSNLLKQALSRGRPLEPEDSQDTIGDLPSVQRQSRNQRHKTLYQIRPWSNYFAECFQVHDQLGQRHFNVYYNPPNHPRAPVFIFHHGIASNGLSFALVSKYIQAKMQQTIDSKASIKENYVAGTIAFDMRGHGKTQVDVNGSDFSLDTMTDDFATVCQETIRLKDLGSNPLIAVGHSMGGAVVSKAVLLKRIKNIIGIAVLDAVEGPALEALSAMDTILASWPRQFDSVDRAIDWHIRTMAINNKESAEVSVQGMIRRQDTDKGESWTWTIDPKATEPYWEDWFIGLSSNFLAAPAARLLILAGTDRLDKQLMIGQMQGKYQLVVFIESGHYVQEDEPEKTAVTLIDFWERNGRPLGIVPKFGKFRAPDAHGNDGRIMNGRKSKRLSSGEYCSA